jgi:hypothetical protein
MAQDQDLGEGSFERPGQLALPDASKCQRYRAGLERGAAQRGDDGDSRSEVTGAVVSLNPRSCGLLVYRPGQACSGCPRLTGEKSWCGLSPGLASLTVAAKLGPGLDGLGQAGEWPPTWTRAGTFNPLSAGSRHIVSAAAI